MKMLLLGFFSGAALAAWAIVSSGTYPHFMPYWGCLNAGAVIGFLSAWKS